jgi:hypothetical protein
MERFRRVLIVCIAVLDAFFVGRTALGQRAAPNDGGADDPTARHDKAVPDRHIISRGSLISLGSDAVRAALQDQIARSPRAATTTEVHLGIRPRPVFPPSAVAIRPIYVVGFYPYNYGYFGDYPFGYPYVLGTDSGYFGPYIAPPIITSGEAQFGPQAVQRFMGVDPSHQHAVQAAPVPRPQAGGAEAAPPHADNRARLKAWRLIDEGDAEFKERRFAQALTRYRDAASAARDLAEAQFRQGFALVAIARYSDAAKAFIRGLQLDPDWSDSNFKLDELYGENKVLESEHIDSLKKALAAHPHDADLLFVLGIYLYFGDHPADSAPLFERAQAVVGPLGDDHVIGFLKHFATDKVPPAKPGDKPVAKLPPPPLPVEEKPQAVPGGNNPAAKPADKGAMKPVDPFEGLDPAMPMAPRRIP